MQEDHDPCLIPLPPSPALTEHFSQNHLPPNSALLISDSSFNPFSFMSTSTEHAESGSSIRVLESTNYHQWSDLMLSYFLEHNLDGIVDGSDEQPTIAGPERQNWLLCQKKAAGFIACKLDASNRDLFISDVT